MENQTQGGLYQSQPLTRRQAVRRSGTRGRLRTGFDARLEKIGIDPVEFIKKNFVKSGDGYYWRDGKWWVSRGVDYTKAVEKGAEAFGWREKWKGWPIPTSVKGTKRRGIGVGVHGNADVGEDVSEAYVRLEPNGKAVLYSCVAEHGTGQRSSLCKMVAEVLNIPLEHVSMTPPDSQINPFEVGPGSSRGTHAIEGAPLSTQQRMPGGDS